MKRGESLFTDASTIINGERQDMYGAPENSFDDIGSRWSTYLNRRKGIDINISAKDVAFMMMEYKMSRHTNQDKRDNLVDIVGYAGILDDLGDA